MTIAHFIQAEKYDCHPEGIRSGCPKDLCANSTVNLYGWYGGREMDCYVSSKN